MTTLEIKKEISKVLDQVPEKLLADILDLLKEVQSKETANALCKLTLYKLAQPQAESVSTDAF